MAPACARPVIGGRQFCGVHAAAPAAQRGGWLSAAKRRAALKIDANVIAPRLYVGSKPNPTIDIPKADVIVLCAEEVQPPELAFHGRVMRCPLPDGPLGVTELRRAVAMSSTVARELAQRHTVLVTCNQGRNRSALVAALALGQVTRLSADDLIHLIREKRSRYCLSNPHFRAILQRIVGPGRYSQRSPG